MGIIDDLRKDRIEDDSILNALIEEMYSTCLKIIKMKNKMGTTEMIYEVPAIYIGFPVYNRELVSLKLSKYFKKKGFKTTYYNPYKIYISW